MQPFQTYKNSYNFVRTSFIKLVWKPYWQYNSATTGPQSYILANNPYMYLERNTASPNPNVNSDTEASTNRGAHQINMRFPWKRVYKFKPSLANVTQDVNATPYGMCGNWIPCAMDSTERTAKSFGFISFVQPTAVNATGGATEGKPLGILEVTKYHVFRDMNEYPGI